MVRFASLTILAAFLLPGIAHAACPPIPFVFAQGAPFNATQVNTNFTSLRDCTNAISVNPVTGPGTSTDGALAFFTNTTGSQLDEHRVQVTGFYYPAATSQALTQVAASQDPAALFALSKTFDTSGLPAGPAIPRPTLYSVCKLNAVGTDPQNKSCRGMMAEGIDNIGGFGTFVEGGKFVGVGSASVPPGTGGAYGVIGWGQSVNSQWTVGVEGQTVKTGGTDAPGPRNFNPNSFVANFVASNGLGVGKRNDVGFLVNPFNAATSKSSTGFACGLDTIEGTAGVCFGDWGGGAVGMDLSLKSKTNIYDLAPILLPNAGPIGWWHTDGTTIIPGIYVAGDNNLHLNKPGDTTTTTVVDGNFFVGGNITVTPGTVATTAIVLAGVNVADLPVCSAGTQGWIKKVNNALAPAWGAVVAAGGTVQVLTMCDGANWVVN